MRETKYELLRILLMLVIVLGHLFMAANMGCVHGDVNRYVWYLMGNGSRVAVNVFLMLGVWFMVDARFSARRILSLYAQVLVYSLPLTVTMLAIGYPVPVKEVFRGLMPFWGRGLWFASAYIVLLFWAPFLKQAFRLPRRAQVLLLTTLFLFTCCTCTVPDPQLSYALDLYWFACMYLFIGFVKRETAWASRANPVLCIGGGILLYCLMATLLWYGRTRTGAAAENLAFLANQWLVDFKTLPNVLSAFLIFIGFSALKMRPNVMVNKLAAGTFGVYVLHCVPSYTHYQFVVLCRIREWVSRPDSWAICALCAVALFGAYSVVDWARARFISPLYLKSRWFGWLCDRVDSVYETCTMRV